MVASQQRLLETSKARGSSGKGEHSRSGNAAGCGRDGAVALLVSLPVTTTTAAAAAAHAGTATTATGTAANANVDVNVCRASHSSLPSALRTAIVTAAVPLVVMLVPSGGRIECRSSGGGGASGSRSLHTSSAGCCLFVRSPHSCFSRNSVTGRAVPCAGHRSWSSVRFLLQRTWSSCKSHWLSYV